MKRVALTLLGVVLAATPALAKDPELKTPKDKLSYAIGYNLAKGMQRSGEDLDADLIGRGIKDGLGGKELISEEEIVKILSEHQKSLEAKRSQQMKDMTEKGRKEGEDFLAKNKTQEGVVTTASGLQYKVLTPGGGKKPGPDSTVTVHYRGMLVNGQEFDSSYKRGQPASFPVKGVIPGWTEALQLMQQGAKWMLYIPPSLAYGERGAGPIPPNSTLIFEVELQDVK